ncbi:MAG TPA: methyl-accepting chemotaxis protein [Myxococcales bacterium]|jgi:methyl-accepting chemotaxis protein|nr:methyl-accepting chemotaxis protein [Myxococcales bacterium]
MAEAAAAPRRPLWRDLRRARWRLLIPLLTVGLVAAPSGVYHVKVTGDWKAGVFRQFVMVLVPSLLFIQWLIYRRARTRLPTLWLLGEKGHQADRAELRQALVELGVFPSFQFRVNFEHWFTVLLVLTAGMALAVPEASAALELRILFAGLCFSPFSGVAARFLAAGACRRIIGRILEENEVPVMEVFKAIPPDRYRLRNHLVMFVATALMFPVIFTADAAFTLTEKEVERLVQEPDRQRRAALEVALEDAPSVSAFVLFGLSAITSLATAFYLGTLLRRPLRRIGEQALKVSRGEPVPPVVIPAEDETWVVSAALTRMQREMTQSLDRLKLAGTRLSSTGRQLIATFDDQRSGANEQASALNETFATTEELARSATQIAENAHEVAEVAQQTLGAAVNGQRSSEQFYASMLRMKLDNQAVADSVVKLNKRMQQIGKIVEFINGIADKSDLLALNAELEGTKAGRVGRGFSLVAAEMRRLSENVMHSTEEIGRLIQEIRDATNAAVMATEAGLKATDAGAQSADRVLESLRQILGLATQTSEAVRSISLATQQQQSGTTQLADAMADILRVTEQSADATRQMNRATTDLSSLAQDLTVVAERFRASNPNGGAAA